MKKNILITGASSGIGKDICSYLCKSNNASWKIFATVRNETDRQRLIDLCDQNIDVFLMDVTNGEQIKTVVEIVKQKTEEAGLHVLLNNAGVSVCMPMECIDFDDLFYQFDVNTFGSLRVIQGFLPSLKLGKGRIVNVGSISTRISLPYMGAYAASKAALERLSMALHGEMVLTQSGVKVINIELGNHKTPLWEKTISNSLELMENMNDSHKKCYSNTMKNQIEMAQYFYRKAPDSYSIVQQLESIFLIKKPKLSYSVGIDSVFLRIVTNLIPSELLYYIIYKLNLKYHKA